MFEPKQIPIFCVQQRAPAAPMNFIFGSRRSGEHGGTGAITEKTGADEHTGIVVKIKGSAADLHTDRKHMPVAARRKQGFSSPHIWQGSAAALANEVEQ